MTDTILIVDDSDIDREMFIRSLRRNTDIQIIQATNASTCYEAIEQYHPHLIFLDMSLPGEDGLTMIKKIHQIPKYHPKVVVFSGSEDENLAQNALSAGATQFLSKSSGAFRELGDIVNSLLKKAQ